MSCRSNGFQDRPVVTTSVTLRVCSLPNGRKRRYQIVLELLLEMPGTGSHRHCKNPVFVRLCGHDRSDWHNGFQDRPVVTTSVTLRVCSLPNGRKQRYKIVLELLLEKPGSVSHRHCKNQVFVRLCGHGRSDWHNGFQDRPVMTASVTLQIKLGKVYPLPEQGINWRRRRDLNPRALYTRLLP